MSSTNQPFNFNHLSIKDLVEARDLFHAHLINKRNVVATAIGRYLIRHSDIDDNGKFIEQTQPSGPPTFIQKKERNLDNSMVIDISWPCILVFLEKWETEQELIQQGASNIVPKNIFMPDGRIIPICTVVAPKVSVEKKEIDVNTLRFPDMAIGGGYPLIIKSQGMTNIATVGCLVSDGHTVYALTNKHVVGEKGQEIMTLFGKNEVVIGKSSGNSLGKIEFNKMYKGWQNNNLLVSCDAGLIEIDDLNEWKTDILGIEQIDEIFDINTLNLNLGLIAEHKKTDGKITPSLSGNVIGSGAVSGLLHGEIAALFYRYKTIGGVEIVSDFLMAGRNGQNLEVHHGDSGFAWLLETMDEDKNKKLQPIALHWGQHQLLQNASKAGYAYSLSTCLSNICRELDVELVRNWNTQLDFSWGPAGHYTIGNRAVFAIDANKFPRLAELMSNNAKNISYEDAAIKSGTFNGDPNVFTPLVDVPDVVFKAKVAGISRFPYENPNHYADVDYTRPSDGKSLLQLSKQQGNLTVEFWQQFYDDLGHTSIKERGLLPFRVKQIFREMVNYLNEDNVVGFVAAAGVLGHYLGDACQPLHGSQFTDGDGIRPETDGIHSVYETKMINKYKKEILSDLTGKITSQESSHHAYNKITAIRDEDDAAKACIALMDVTMKRIPPKDMLDVYYDAVVADSKAAGLTALWDNFGEETKETMARGARYLSKTWEAAWALANAENNNALSTTKISTTKLKNLYLDKENFLKSYSLDQIGAYFNAAVPA